MPSMSSPITIHIYSVLVLPMAFLFGAVGILQGVYAKYFGLPLASIASVLLISRAFDAISDPIIGYYADKYQAHYGNRKPFIFCGCVLFMASSWFLFNPPNDVTVGYFLVWFLAFYLAYTLFDIPHLAWGGELANDSLSRNTIYGLRTFYFFLGSLFFYAMPILFFSESNEFTPQALKFSVFIACILMLPMLAIFLNMASDEKIFCPHSNRVPELENPYKDRTIREVLCSIIANKPFRVLSAAHTCTGFGYGMWFTMLFIFVDGYLALGEHFSWMFVVSFGTGLVSLRLWYVLASHYGKQTTWRAGMVLVFLGLCGTGLLEPNHTSQIELLICMSLICSGFSSFGIMVPSILSDIVDFGTWKFKIDNSATYFSIYTLINKTVFALGGALSLGVAALFNFDVTLASHSAQATFGLRLGVAWIPASFVLLSIFIIGRIPINSQRHAIISRRLGRCLVMGKGTRN